jgi:GNAT superfamily N-acetyltransferase
MPPGSWWARGALPPKDIFVAPKFAVIELLVLPEYRGHGIGRTLHDELLKERHEPYATLAALPEADAYGMYLRWGWKLAGEVASEPPHSRAMTLQLR